MSRKMLILFFVCCTGIPALAQDLSNIQIHGFATQGVLYSNNNNFFTTNSTSGSVEWTDAAVSFTDTATDKLRIGAQLHMYALGQLGGSEMDVDWASGDYRVAPWLGFRAGKVKTRLGLFNDSQDVDAVFLWALLPESIYPTDNKSYYLSHLGFDTYGTVDLGKNAGKVSYTGYVGYRTMDLHGGYLNIFEQPPFSMVFSAPPGGGVYGGDIRWQAPLRGLTVGISAHANSLNGTAQNGGTLTLADNLTLAYCGQYEKGKFFAAAEYRRDPISASVATTAFTVPFVEDEREWYVMTGYRVLEKLQVGTYYSEYEDKAANTSLAANYLKDWTVSGRYDFNQYFYAKLEGHLVRGAPLAFDFYSVNNPNGAKPNSDLLAVKVGFTF